jgi:RNA polymerase sigma-70 factor (ECF subfamily)
LNEVETARSELLADEPDLVRRAREGDREAMGDLFRIHSGAVRRLLRGVVGPRVDVDDLAQEVFISAYRSVRAYRGDSAFSTWLHRVAVNTAISHLRSLARRQRPMEPSEAARRVADEGPDAHELTVGKEMIRRLYEILDTVSPKRRAAFTLFEIEGLSLLDLARVTGVSRATAKSRVWFARREIAGKAKGDPYLGPLLEELER